MSLPRRERQFLARPDPLYFMVTVDLSQRGKTLREEKRNQLFAFWSLGRGPLYSLNNEGRPLTPFSQGGPCCSRVANTREAAAACSDAVCLAHPTKRPEARKSVWRRPDAHPLQWSSSLQASPQPLWSTDNMGRGAPGTTPPRGCHTPGRRPRVRWQPLAAGASCTNTYARRKDVPSCHYKAKQKHGTGRLPRNRCRQKAKTRPREPQPHHWRGVACGAGV